MADKLYQSREYCISMAYPHLSTRLDFHALNKLRTLSAAQEWAQHTEDRPHSLMVLVIPSQRRRRSLAAADRPSPGSWTWSHGCSNTQDQAASNHRDDPAASCS